MGLSALQGRGWFEVGVGVVARQMSLRDSIPRGQLVAELWPMATRAEVEAVPHSSTRGLRKQGARALQARLCTAPQL